MVDVRPAAEQTGEAEMGKPPHEIGLAKQILHLLFFGIRQTVNVFHRDVADPDDFQHGHKDGTVTGRVIGKVKVRVRRQHAPAPRLGRIAVTPSHGRRGPGIEIKLARTDIHEQRPALPIIPTVSRHATYIHLAEIGPCIVIIGEHFFIRQSHIRTDIQEIASRHQ